jgi:predicted metalloprotease with PDZ domain
MRAMPQTSSVRYLVSMERPNTRLFVVEGRFDVSGRSSLELSLPVWTPGSYLVREYARHLQDFSAADERGRALVWTRVDKRTFRIETAGASEVVAIWRVYANDLTVRAAHLDDSHGYFNGATLFLHDEQRRGARHEVRIQAPADWRPFCALPKEGDAFVASDYDTLIDSPFEVGPHQAHSFSAANVPHEVVIWGEGNFDRAKLLNDLQAIVEAEAKLFGGLPFSRYLFLVLLSDQGRGGLEHMASTTLLYPRFGFKPKKAYEEFLVLASHEYFHAWNVKRIKPKALVPFDYSQENYTRLLWVMEGFTSYYDTLLVRRAGLINAERYLERQGENLSSLAQTPGRLVQSLDDSSLCTWIKYYRPDENSANSSVSYYLKGEVVAMLLDLELRRITRDERSLDDVMRLLFTRYGDGRGVPEDGVEAVVNEVAGRSMADFFAKAVHAPGELDYEVLRHVGLEVRGRTRENANDKGGTPPPKEKESTPAAAKGHLGAVTKTQNDRLLVNYPLANSPAMMAGLCAGDELVALDGFRIEPDKFQARLEEYEPGAKVKLTIFRRDSLRTLEVQLSEKPSDALYFARREDATPEQKRSFERWLGEPFEHNPK